MAGVSVAAEWQLLYNRYYRKPQIYQMQWKHVDLSRNKVACAPFGGPIAVIRDDSKIVQLYAESALRKLRIFNSAGLPLSETVWKNPGGRLIGMSWTHDQALVCITQDGIIYRYNLHAQLMEPNLHLGNDLSTHSVIECVFWENGVVCLSDAYQVFCVSDFQNPRPCKLADPGIEDAPLCMAVIEPQYTMSGNVEVLMAVSDHVLLVEEDGVQQVGIGVGPLQKMMVSRNGKLLASFTHDGRLLVMASDFSNIIFEHNCEIHCLSFVSTRSLPWLDRADSHGMSHWTRAILAELIWLAKKSLFGEVFNLANVSYVNFDPECAIWGNFIILI
ncbi:unnamed protein product [Ilex paraguariensis]|uniref:Vps16 N-terminal domain-containing protein n=1 Tax=Ilex paraguariensis TaxID=185542 RepID=A0ABC8TG73_9AQUA